MNKVTITVSAQATNGGPTIASVLKELLTSNGFKNIEIGENAKEISLKDGKLLSPQEKENIKITLNYHQEKRNG